MTNLPDDHSGPETTDPGHTGRIPRISRRDTGRTRTHHVVRREPNAPPIVDPDAGPIWGGDAWERYERRRAASTGEPELDAWVETFEDIRPVRRRGGTVDPLLLRVGAIVGAAVLITPILIGLRGGDDSAGGELRAEVTSIDGADPSLVTSAPSTAAPTSAAARRRERRAAAAARAQQRAQEPEGQSVAVVVDEPATQVAPCAMDYAIASGDYWIRIADAAGVELDELLDVNGASFDTPIYVGDEICLPEGASAPDPPPPVTTPPATTQVPAPTDPPDTTPDPTSPPTTEPPPSTAPPTTAPPTTDPPTTDPPTTDPPTTDPPESGSPEDIIREIWPDELEDKAVTIAQRESSLVPTAYNGVCCYGLFQIYFEVNRSFLANLGITSSNQLLDARTNARAAYAMYQLSGWDPWSQTNY